MTQFDEKLAQIYGESKMEGGVVKGRISRAVLGLFARILLRGARRRNR